MTCSICSGTGWKPDTVEGEKVFYLCECRTKGVAFPGVCSVPGCQHIIQKREVICPAHRAVFDAQAAAEEWGHAEKVMEALALLFDLIGLPAEQEAVEDAVIRARVSADYYKEEYARLGRRPE